MRYLYSILIALSLIVTSCSKEKDKPAPVKFKLSEQVVEVGCQSQECSIYVTSPACWTATTDSEWITFKNDIGDAGMQELKFVVDDYKEVDDRAAIIVVANDTGSLYAELIVSQRAFVPEFEVEAIPTIEFDYAGGTQSVNITSNFAYEVVTSEDWLVVTEANSGLKVTANALYPVLNVPRSATIVISDPKYGFEQVEIEVVQHCKESDYKIGDMLEFNGSRGVVFYRDAQTTKIVSVEQGKEIWSTEYIVVGASDAENGVNNMAVIQAVDSWESKYPAFAWCANLGEGWYLPAYNELQAIWEVRSQLDKPLVDNGYTAIGSTFNFYHWSSTECDKDNAFRLYYYTGVGDHSYKYYESYVRAVYAF